MLNPFTTLFRETMGSVLQGEPVAKGDKILRMHKSYMALNGFADT